jgi:hypothetical protein
LVNVRGKHRLRFFAEDSTWVPHDAAEYPAEQMGVTADELSGYDFDRRTVRRHCAEILKYLGFCRMMRGDRETLSRWISGELCRSGHFVSTMLEVVFLWCRDRNMYGPSAKELERLVRSQQQQYLDDWLHEVSAALPPDAVVAMESSLADAEGPTGFNAMTARLSFIRKLDLPRNMLSNINPAWIEHVARQLSLYAVYLMRRETAMTDAMVELLVETVHKITTQSKRKVVGDIAKDVERVYGCSSTLHPPRLTIRTVASAMSSFQLSECGIHTEGSSREAPSCGN